jgi:1,2-diacylglycerol 3-alpha-glucosyltransferase
LRIAQVCPRYSPDIGGVETEVKEISERLVLEGHDVEVITTDPTGKLKKKDIINGVKVTRFRSFAPGNAYYFAPQIYIYLKKNKYDVVHAHSYHALPALFTAISEHKKKFVFSPYYHRGGHTQFRNLLHKPYKLFGKMVFSRADTIICISEYEKGLVESDFDVAEKTVKIPVGLNLSEFENLKRHVKKNKEKMLLYVGRLEEYKGVQYIVDCLPELVDFKLTIVGKGPYENEIRLLAEKLGVQDRIQWLKNISREKLIECYFSADVFLMLSKKEAYGITVAEALISDTPCIVANESALSEFVDGEHCLGISYPIDIGELTNKIKLQIFREKKVDRIQKKVLSWESVMKQVLLVYERHEIGSKREQKKA